MTKFRSTAAALLLALGAIPAHAHYLWLEPVGSEARLCFGEYENALREQSGGRLDTIATPVVQGGDGKSVALQRKADHFALAAPADQPLVAQETGMGVKDLRQHNLGIVKPMYYARFAVADAEGASASALDIRPLDKGRLSVRLHGKPLAKAKLSVFAPNRWLREYETDAAGEVRIETPWPGLYVVEVTHVEALKGEYQGAAYEGVRHVGTLSFRR